MPDSVPAETLAEQTAQIGELITSVREMEARVDAAQAAARKRAPKPAPRTPLAWSAALVFIVAALCVFGGWVAYLAL